MVWEDVLAARATLQQAEELLHPVPLPAMIGLCVLSREEGGRATMSTFAERLGATMSGGTNIADRLLKAKLIERDRCLEDRRVVFAKITKKGKTALRIAKERLAGLPVSWDELTGG